jgi:DNA mismatch repair ATPase MutS
MNRRLSDNIFVEMEKTVDHLITVAEQLKDTSFHITSSELIGPLQKEQERLLEELSVIENRFKKEYPQNVPNSTEIKTRISEKLEIFQTLNQEFISNLNKSKEVIQFQKED